MQFIGHIMRQIDGFLTCRTDRLGKRVASMIVDIADDDFGALACQRLHARLADPRCTTGDESNLVLNLPHDLPPRLQAVHAYARQRPVSRPPRMLAASSAAF